MKYRLNDWDAGGIYNGISYDDVITCINEYASKMGYAAYEFDDGYISRKLSADDSLREIAQQNYTADPIKDGWGEEYKQTIRNLAKEGKAPGYGIVPDEMVYAAVAEAMQHHIDNVIIPRQVERCRMIVNGGWIVSTREEARQRAESWNNVVNEGGSGYIPLFVTQAEYDEAAAYLKEHNS